MTPDLAPPLLSIEDLSIEIDTSRGTIQPVRNVTLDIARGEMLGLVGESGSGKSVTAMSIMRLLPKRSVRVTSGRIIFEGKDLTTMTDRSMRDIRGNDVSAIFQEPMTALNPVLTVVDQVTEPLRRHMGLTRRKAHVRARDLLNMAGIHNVDRVLSDYPHQLSGGMRQRVMIAMAMGCEPKLLIADEPTTALDVTTQMQILDLVMDLQSVHGTSVLLITHDLGVVAQTCQRVAVMHDGRLQETAPVEQLFANPSADYTRHLLSMRPPASRRVAAGVSFVPRTAASGNADAGDTQTTGQVATSDQAAPATEGPPLLEVRDLVKIFPGRGGRTKRRDSVVAVNGVSFSVRAGRTIAIVGESGSGKSTIGRALLRLHEPTSGSVVFDGVDLLTQSRDHMRGLRARMQIIFQDTYASLDPRWTIVRTLSEPLRLHTDMSKSQIRERIIEVMELVGLPGSAIDRFPHEFSGGQRQRLGIARALLLNPDLVVCDEPVSALDVSIQAQVLALMKELQARLGLAYVFISHDLAVIEMMADDVIVMRNGVVVERGTVEQIFATPQHKYTKALLAAIPAAEPSARISRSERREIIERGLSDSVEHSLVSELTMP